jgi:integrase
VLFEVMLYTGLRPGEAFGLRPDDLDFNRAALLVERSFDEHGGGVKPTKTCAVRWVDLDHFPDCRSLLEQYLAWLKREALRLGWGDPQWLFPNELGGNLDAAKVRREFAAVLKSAKIPRRRVYDLRHSFGSLRLAQGAPLTYIASQMGHESPTTTLKYYAHWIPDTRERWFGTKSGTNAQKNDDPQSEESGETSAAVGDSEWSRRRELNSRPADYELSETPAERIQKGQPPPESNDLEGQ